ncbi:hypothetical protein [Reichenbachiella agariperforans]|nr:hypothetical protein [Reichenbachiella agariperforans]
MRQLLLFILLSITTLSLPAQNFDVSFFEKSGGKVGSEVDKNIKEYRHLKKENEAWLKEQDKRYETMEDSLRLASDSDSLEQQIGEDSLAVLQELQREHYRYTDSLYSYEALMSWDEAKRIAKEETKSRSRDILESHDQLSKYTSLNNSLLKDEKEYREYKDSLKHENLPNYEEEYLLEVKRKELAEKYNEELEGYAKKELEQSEQLVLPVSSPEMERLQEMNKLAKAASLPDEDLANTATANEDFFADKSEALSGAMEQTEELKEKYSAVTDATDLTSATKRNSMKGKPMAERLVLGGNFQLRIDEHTSVDVSPELQYLITKKWSVGVGGNYRANGDLIEINSDFQETQVYGYRVFTEYYLVSHFYAHVEMESLSNGSALKTPEMSKAQTWQYSALAGIESQFKIRGRLKGQVSILYNFMHQTNPLNAKPWNVRFGLMGALK